MLFFSLLLHKQLIKNPQVGRSYLPAQRSYFYISITTGQSFPENCVLWSIDDQSILTKIE